MINLLVEDLSVYLQKKLKYSLETKKGRRSIKIFKYFLPTKRKETEDDFPLIIIRPFEGEDSKQSDATVKFICGVYSQHGATITYLLCSADGKQANANVLKMKAALRILGYIPTANDSTNETFYVHRNGYVIAVYHKTDFSHCIFPNEELAETLKTCSPHVRIEVYMQGHYLRERGWDALESWRNAYAEGRYEAIFNELVRGLFKLDVVLRHKAPRKEALKNLTATECAIVQAYARRLLRLMRSPRSRRATTNARSKIKSKWKKIIRDKLRIDITIPWEQHQKLHHSDMDRLVRYPGDYWPDAVTVAECFCEENWPKLRKRLKTLRSDKAAHKPSE